MAEVYLARDRLLDRQVVLKVLSSELARDPAFVQRFRREAQAAANLSHPNIVAVYDWGEEDGTYFIVMEYVEGPTLRDVIQRQGSAHPRRAAQIATEIASALAYAHRNGVIHRDVKPGNILLTTDEKAKVTDFGIARAGTTEALTQTGSVMGTATYFSPEQAQGMPVDARSDVYSLGVVIYEMVCGTPPFSGDSPISIAYKHVSEAPPLPSRVNPDIPPALEQIILMSMAKDPADRYSSAEDLQADLSRFRRGEALASEPMTAVVSQIGGDFAPELAADRTMVTPSVRAGSATGATRAIETYAVRPQPRRMNPWVPVLVILLLAVFGAAGFWAYQQASGGGSLTVPGVVGKQFDDAKAQLVGDGFEKVVADLEINDDVPENEVFEQSPPPGSKRDPGDTITLKVSQGRSNFEMLDVVGETELDAIANLQNEDLEVRVREEASEDQDAGIVFKTDPAKGEPVKRGDLVTIYVATGKPDVDVPDVDGLDAVAAALKLGQAGFDVEHLDESSESMAKGKVIRTDPPGGAPAPGGSKIKMYVSTGPKPTVPNVKNMTESDARSALEAKGYVPDVTYQSACLPSSDGEVTSQSPSAGTKLDAGETVSIVVCNLLATTTTS